jgi:beta-mannosidase
LFYTELPGIITKHNPQTAYWPSSPSSFNDELPDKKSGDTHEWRIWNEAAPFTAYADKPGRFVSEYGMQSFPCMKTLQSFSNDTDLEIRSPLMDFRQRSNMPWISAKFNGTQMIMNYIQMYYNDPSDFESFVYLSQVVQADALKAAIEAHRLYKPQCMGSLYLQLNDCWPTISWSTIDYFGRWKPAHYTVRKSFTNVLIIPQHSAGSLKVFAVNDSLSSLEAELRLKVIDFDGKQLWNETDTVLLKPDTVQMLWQAREDKVCPAMLKSKVFMLAQLWIKGKVLSENLLYFTDPKYLDLPVPDISYKINGKLDHYELIMVTNKFAKNVVLDTFEKDARFSNNNFDLLPGRKLRISVNYPGTPEELQNDLKIYTLANSF